MSDSENMVITNHDNEAFLLGNNWHEPNTLVIPAGKTVKIGAMLRRGSGEKLVPVTASDTDVSGVCLSPNSFINTGTADMEVQLRTTISGEVNAFMVNVDGVAATKTQLDMIRSYGMVPVYSREMNHLDNQ